jgi:moderate conductance mechanosensitive channel
MLAWLENVMAYPFIGQAIRLLLLAILFISVRQALRISASRTERHIDATVIEADRRRRLNTLLRAAYGTAMVALTAIVTIMALQLIGLRIEPLLASAGVAGLAISLGAQSLIKDYIGGALILAEDQFRVGDVVDVNGVSGEVVRMTLRVTYLRNVEGKLFSVPNGEIRTITNMTRDWSRAIVELNLDFDTDVDLVTRALVAAAERLQDDPETRDALLSPPEIVDWTNLSEWSIQVRVMAKTLPGKQWGVGRALRRAAVEALRASGVRVAVPITLLRDTSAER